MKSHLTANQTSSSASHCVCMCVSHSVRSYSLLLWTVASQAPLSMQFSSQEYWNGLSFLFPGDLPEPGIKPGSPALQADSLLSVPPGKSGFLLLYNSLNLISWHPDTLQSRPHLTLQSCCPQQFPHVPCTPDMLLGLSTCGSPL